MGQLLIRPLSPQDEDGCLAAQHELTEEGFSFLWDLRPGEAWPSYVARVLAWPHGGGLPEGAVPATFLLGVSGGDVAARVLLRYELNPFLAEVGGHVGYAVRRGYRRRGYATALLQEACDLARRHGLDRLLLTCDEDNSASAAVIEGAGGKFERTSVPWEGQPIKRRYWIGL